MMAAARPALALLLALLAACAPRLEEQGAARGEPALEPGAIAAGDGHRLPLRVWPAAEGPRAVVLALHGVNDYSNAFAAPAAWWAARGIATYAYDQRGFGAGSWAGTDAMVADVREAARVVGARHPGVPLYLLGSSMGGAVLLAADARAPLDGVAGLVLAGPAVRGRATLPLSYRVALWLGVRTLPAARLGGGGLGIVPSDNVEMLRALGRDPLVIGRTRIDVLHGLVDLMDEALAAAPATRTPTLVLYGARDEIVPREATLRMLAGLAAPHRVARYAEGYHMLLRDLQAERVWRDIAAWIADPSAPLPSGAEIGGRAAGAGSSSSASWSERPTPLTSFPRKRESRGGPAPGSWPPRSGPGQVLDPRFRGGDEDGQPGQPA